MHAQSVLEALHLIHKIKLHARQCHAHQGCGISAPWRAKGLHGTGLIVILNNYEINKLDRFRKILPLRRTEVEVFS